MRPCCSARNCSNWAPSSSAVGIRSSFGLLRGFAQGLVGQLQPGRPGHRVEQGHGRGRVGRLGEVVRDVHRETDRGAVLLAQPELEQGGRAPRDLEPVHQRGVAVRQPGPGPVSGNAERPGVRGAHRDAVESDREPGPHPPRQVAHAGAEALPLVVGLRPVQQQERRADRVPHQMYRQFRNVVVLPVIPGEGHRWPSGPVVDQAVHIEPGDLFMLQRAQQVRGQELACRTRVDEAVQVVQQGRSVKFRRLGADLVEVSRVSHYDHSPSGVSARCLLTPTITDTNHQRPTIHPVWPDRLCHTVPVRARFTPLRPTQ